MATGPARQTKEEGVCFSIPTKMLAVKKLQAYHSKEEASGWGWGGGWGGVVWHGVEGATAIVERGATAVPKKSHKGGSRPDTATALDKHRNRDDWGERGFTP